MSTNTNNPNNLQAIAGGQSQTERSHFLKFGAPLALGVTVGALSLSGHNRNTVQATGVPELATPAPASRVMKVEKAPKFDASAYPRVAINVENGQGPYQVAKGVDPGAFEGPTSSPEQVEALTDFVAGQEVRGQLSPEQPVAVPVVPGQEAPQYRDVAEPGR